MAAKTLSGVGNNAAIFVDVEHRFFRLFPAVRLQVLKGPHAGLDGQRERNNPYSPVNPFFHCHLLDNRTLKQQLQ
jgi:hypothetical protein